MSDREFETLVQHIDDQSELDEPSEDLTYLEVTILVSDVYHEQR